MEKAISRSASTLNMQSQKRPFSDGFKVAVPKTFVIFTRKRLYWSLFDQVATVKARSII